MVKRIAFIFLIILVISCSKTVEYHYPTGELLSEVEVDNAGKNNGKLKQYYKTGELLGVGNYINGLKDGLFIKFFKSGNVKASQKWSKGEIIDTTKLYFENGNVRIQQISNPSEKEFDTTIYFEDGGIKREGKILDTTRIDWWKIYSSKTKNLEYEVEYINLDTVSYLNQVIAYDEKGDINFEKSKFYEVLSNNRLENDSLNIIEIKLHPSISKKFDFHMLYYSIYDENRNLIKTDSSYGKNHLTAKIHYRPNEIGTNYLRGYFFEKGLDYEDDINDSTMVNVYYLNEITYFNEKLIVVK